MPLYIDEAGLPAMPTTHVEAIRGMAHEIGDRAVNPAMAVQLLRRWLLPLIPQPHQRFFELPGQPTWDKLWDLYAKLVFASEGHDALLIAAAHAVGFLVRHTAQPERGVEFARHVEVASFRRIADRLGLPVPEVGLLSPTVGALHDFCKYCWLPERSHGVCRYHSTRPEDRAPRDRPLCATTSLKQVQRLRPAFEAHLRRLGGSEEFLFHESLFSAEVLVPSSGLSGWLDLRRPKLAQLVQGGPSPLREHALGRLLRVLYGGDSSMVAEAIGGAVHLLTPITLRAEAWLMAYTERPAWGGSRVSTGRRRRVPTVVPDL
jgi:hypothetical protein